MPEPIHPHTLDLLLLLAEEPHTTASAAAAIGASRASVVRWLAEAREHGAVVEFDRARRRFIVAPSTAREAQRRLELLKAPFPAV
jgi:biotin operon repressor